MITYATVEQNFKSGLNVRFLPAGRNRAGRFYFRILVLFDEFAVFVKDQISAFYFGFIHGFARGVGYAAGFLYFGAIIVCLYIGRSIL